MGARCSWFGLDIRIDGPADTIATALGNLPSQGSQAEAGQPIVRMRVRQAGADRWSIDRDGLDLHDEISPADLVTALRRSIEEVVSRRSPTHVFLHAGVVARDGGALVIAGRSRSGKSSLVASLIRQGALYLSDEFAPVDGAGLVHPFPRPLGIRPNRRDMPEPVPPEVFNARIGDGPLPVTGVALVHYDPDGHWMPEPRSQGEGVLGLLDNAVTAREQPERCLAVIGRAVSRATVVAGERGDADETAAAMLANPALWVAG